MMDFVHVLSLVCSYCCRRYVSILHQRCGSTHKKKEFLTSRFEFYILSVLCCFDVRGTSSLFQLGTVIMSSAFPWHYSMFQPTGKRACSDSIWRTVKVTFHCLKSTTRASSTQVWNLISKIIQNFISIVRFVHFFCWNRMVEISKSSSSSPLCWAEANVELWWIGVEGSTYWRKTWMNGHYLSRFSACQRAASTAQWAAHTKTNWNLFHN